MSAQPRWRVSDRRSGAGLPPETSGPSLSGPLPWCASELGEAAVFISNSLYLGLGEGR